MGQYFKLVNINKREYLHPHCCGDGLKFLEITTGGMPALLAYLLRQSNGGGGGDIPLVSEMAHMVKSCTEDLKKPENQNEKSQEFYKHHIEHYKKALAFAKKIKYAGRWAGDRITLVGDYDDSGLYNETAGMDNITHFVMEEYNEVVGDEESMLFAMEWHTCETYRSKEDRKELYDRIPNIRTMINEGRYTPAESGYEEIDSIVDAINLLEAEDEYYGKYKEPKWKFQRPKNGQEPKHKGLMKPDMVLTAKGDNQ